MGPVPDINNGNWDRSQRAILVSGTGPRDQSGLRIIMCRNYNLKTDTKQVTIVTIAHWVAHEILYCQVKPVILTLLRIYKQREQRGPLLSSAVSHHLCCLETKLFSHQGFIFCFMVRKSPLLVRIYLEEDRWGELLWWQINK